MSGPKAPIDPSTGKRDWEYNEPIDRGNSSSNEDDFDEDDAYFGSDEYYSDPYENNPHDEPIC